MPDNEVIINIPDGIELEGETLDAETIQEALAALAKQKAQKSKARERRESMTEDEKVENAQAAKKRRAKVALQVKYAEDNGYLPSKEEIDAFLAAS